MDTILNLMALGVTCRGIASHFATKYDMYFRNVVETFEACGTAMKPVPDPTSLTNKYSLHARPPSLRFIAYCFLRYFGNNKLFYSAQIEKLGATTLHMDHTYKICKR